MACASVSSSPRDLPLEQKEISVNSDTRPFIYKKDNSIQDNVAVKSTFNVLSNKTTEKTVSTSTSNLPPQHSQPPDGGWGWFVVFASFMIHVVMDGIVYSIGIFHDEFLSYFGESNSKTAWVASLLSGMTLCSGPLSSLFVNKYGCRTVTIGGSILASASLLASVWAQSILTLFITVGLGTGLGFGLIYLPAIVSVTCYFEKYRSLATGIAVCGAGVGTFLFSPLNGVLIKIYGWRGAFLILSAITLNCIVFGIFFRPLKSETKSNDAVPKKVSVERSTSLNKTTLSVKYQRPNSTCGIDGRASISYQNGFSNGRIRSTLSQPTLIPKMMDSRYAEMHSKSLGNGRIMSRPDILYQGSLENVRLYSRSSISAKYEEMILPTSSLRSLPNESIRKKSVGVVYNSEPPVCKHKNSIKNMLDLNLLIDPIFIIFTLSNFFTSLGFYVPYIYIKSQAIAKGIGSDESNYLLSIMGIANTIGRIILGFISDKPGVNRLLTYNLCLTVCGIGTILSATCSTFVGFALYSVIFGVSAGAYVGLTSVVLVDLLGLQRLTNAFGILLLFQGFATFIGPPIAGWFYDVTNSYDTGFYAAGSMIAISGLILFLIPPVQRCIQRKVNERMNGLINSTNI